MTTGDTNLVFCSPLAPQLHRFLAFKRAAGCRYHEEARELRVLDRFLLTHLDPQDPVITDALLRAYLARQGQVSETTRANRLSLIRGLCRFLALEDPRTAVPPARFLHIQRRTFVPRVLTREEGRRFLQVCETLPPGRLSPFSGMVHGTVLLLLYLTGLRLGEALGLNREDVDLETGVLRIRQAKFGKSRLVPMAPDLTERMRACQHFLDTRLGLRDPHACCFPGPRGTRCRAAAVRYAFRKALVRAGIPYRGPGQGPRLHDLRHSFAVHRLLLWYEQGVDLNAYLPFLATYLGHVGLAGTQRYLRLTEDLVGEVTRRHAARFGHLITERGTP